MHYNFYTAYFTITIHAFQTAVTGKYPELVIDLNLYLKDGEYFDIKLKIYRICAAQWHLMIWLVLKRFSWAIQSVLIVAWNVWNCQYIRYSWYVLTVRLCYMTTQPTEIEFGLACGWFGAASGLGEGIQQQTWRVETAAGPATHVKLILMRFNRSAPKTMGLVKSTVGRRS